MKWRSHLDLTLFIRFVHIQAEDVPPDVAKRLSGPIDADVYSSAWWRQFSATPAIIAHEHYHYWQVLRLPFLFWYAILAQRSFLIAFRALVETNLPFSEWDAVVPDLLRINRPEQCLRFSNGSFGIGEPEVFPPGTDVLEQFALTPLDLMEAATSIAQWQLTSPLAILQDCHQFRKWTKLNPTYTSVFNLVASYLGSDELTLRVLISLVSVAFETTNPVLAFLWLLTALKKTGVGYMGKDEPCQWYLLFRDLLDDMPFEAATDSAGSLLETPFCRLTLDVWVNGAGIGGPSLLPHSFLHRPAARWIAREKEDPVYSWALMLPAYAPEGFVLRCMDEFFPLTVACFHMPDRNKVLVLARQDEATPPAADLLDVLAFYSVLRRATGDPLVDHHRLCHHHDCPHYASNYCNSYPLLPEKFADCGFPSRLTTFIEGWAAYVKKIVSKEKV